MLLNYKSSLLIIFYLINYNYTLLSQTPISNQNGFIKEILISGNPNNFCLLADLVNTISANRPKDLKLTAYFDYKIDSLSFFKIKNGNKQDTLIKNGCSKEFFDLINNKITIIDNNSKNLSNSWNSYAFKHLSVIKSSLNQNNPKKKSNCEVLSLQVEGYRNQWVQDYYISFKSKNDIIEIKYYDDKNKATLIKLKENNKKIIISKLDSIEINQSKYYSEIQGGNYLILDSSLAFVGKNYEHFGKQNLKTILHVEEIIFIYSDSAYYGHHQAAFHIDLFMNFAGTLSNNVEKTKNLILFSLVENAITIKEKKWNKVIRQTIKNLENDIFRLDINNFVIDSIPIIIEDEYILSYANCIFEEDVNSNTKNIYLPHYYANSTINSNQIETKIKTKLKNKYNINTFFIKEKIENSQIGFENSAKNYGSLKCLTKVLSRY